MELMAVVAVAGLVAAMAVTRFGHGATEVASAKGYARRLALALDVARRQAVAEGTPAAVVVTRSGGTPTGVSVVRASGTDVLTDEPMPLPYGVDLTTAHDRWQFDYSGSLTTPAAGGTVTISTADWIWELSVNAVTGKARLTETYGP